ncbi:MAG: hypothetical protein AUJ96_16875 [Armatimonadetes bacterium CG2_30_66_41]|nr:MAG: hypothetical protein AUJ96_16875 [Armatimonadetes bacterium CG2_30_66_41]
MSDSPLRCAVLGQRHDLRTVLALCGFRQGPHRTIRLPRGEETIPNLSGGYKVRAPVHAVKKEQKRSGKVARRQAATFRLGGQLDKRLL